MFPGEGLLLEFRVGNPLQGLPRMISEGHTTANCCRLALSWMTLLQQLLSYGTVMDRLARRLVLDTHLGMVEFRFAVKSPDSLLALGPERQ